MNKFNPFKRLLLVTFLGAVTVTNAQTLHPLSFGVVGTNPYSNYYADYVGTRFEVVSPVSIGGNKPYTEALPGGTGGWTVETPVTVPIVNVPIIMGPAGDTQDNSSSGFTAGSMTGKIAVIWRGGGVQFGKKALDAQNAGAVACVIIQDLPGEGPIGMAAATYGGTVSIPLFMIGYDDGTAISGAYSQGTGTVTMTITPWGVGNANDLGFVPYGYSIWHDYAVPANQLSSTGNSYGYNGIDGGFVANYGTQNATNVVLSSTVTFTPTGGSATTIHTNSETLASFPASDSIWAIYEPKEYNIQSAITDAGSGVGTGMVSVNYLITSDSIDQFPEDNAANYSFYITDSLYSKGRYDFVKNVPIAELYESPAKTANSGDFYIWGPMYYVATGGTAIQNVQWTMSSQTDTGHIPTSITLLPIYVFQWIDGSTVNITGNVPDSLIENGELFLVGMGVKNFSTDTNPGDTSSGQFSVAIGDSNGNASTILLDSNSWYFIAPDLPTGWFLGCDGAINTFPRTYGRYNFNNYLEYPAAMWPGDRYTGLAPQVNNPTAALAPATFGGESALIDSTIFSTQLWIEPAIPFTVTNHPVINSVKNVNPSFGSLQLYPNPATDYINFALNLNQPANEVMYTVLDVSARVVSQVYHKNVQNEIYRYNTSNLAAGTYFITIAADGNSMFRKFTVVR